MEHGIGRARHPCGPHRAGGRPKEGQQLDRPAPDILVRLAGGLPDWLPTRSWLGDDLVRPRFIFTPDREPQRLAQAVGLLDQPLFASVSGSRTVTVPLLRWRWAVPVGHQVRVR